MRIRTLLFAASALVLVAGLSAGLALYVSAPDEPEASAESALLLSPGSSKVYIREIQRFGGADGSAGEDHVHQERRQGALG